MHLDPPRTDLKSLRLADVAIKASYGAVLPLLEEISLYEIVSDHALSTIVNRATLPALRAFAFDCSDAYDHTALLSDLVDHVEVFSLDVRILSELPQPLINKLKEKTLFDQSVEGDELSPVSFIRAYSSGDPMLAQVNLGEISFLLSNSSAPSPSLLYLSSSLRAEYVRQEATETTVNIRRICERRGIEVVFEEQPSTWEFDYNVPRDFWRRMKERKK
jgi:hypothetical protein